LLIAALLTRAGAVAACERSAAQFRYTMSRSFAAAGHG
jgi:hypothetical protein